MRSGGGPRIVRPTWTSSVSGVAPNPPPPRGACVPGCMVLALFLALLFAYLVNLALSGS